MRKSLTILIAKSIAFILRLVGSSGTALPGLVAEKIDPQILYKIAHNNFPKGIVVVTGTNGKTTTAKIIVDILRKQGINTLNNRAGSNLYRGIVATIVSASNVYGKTKYTTAVFEVDEAYIPAVCKALNPKIVLVTNLFRDQLDRYGELNSIRKNFDRTFGKLTSKLILNADDPLVADIGRINKNKSKPIYFGISDFNGQTIKNDFAADSIFDPVTNEKLIYKQRYFGHIGVYKSKSTSYRRPKPDYDVVKSKAISSNGVKFDIKFQNSLMEIDSDLPGLYSIYNLSAAFATLSELGVPEIVIQKGISGLKAAFGRGETLSYQNKPIRMLLIKNPTGFNQIIATFLKPKPQNKPVLICINDNIADGRDVSWLWDSAIEDIKSYKSKIIVSGTRCYDMGLRLKYAGISNFEVISDMARALKIFSNLLSPKKVGYILPTYTAMLKLRKIITTQSVPHNSRREGDE